MDKSVMPECYADTLLIETLVPTQTGYNHKHSCFKVESDMKKIDRFAVGIIDKDKKTIAYLKDFEIVDSVQKALILSKHKTRHQYIIQILPALEMWVLNICEAEAIDLTNFGLTDNLSSLKEYTKSISSLENENLKALFKEIAKRDTNTAVRKLKWWIKILKEKNYNVDINELKNG